jgi:7-carboxy-7-deazaguanine synthase
VEKKFRIAEIFGPTIQGEGERIGTRCIFVRFGGCDFRCPPCDSPHAVLPHLVARLPQMSTKEIVHQVYELDPDCQWVVFSGGNPALLDLEDLILRLHSRGTSVMIETQGSVYHPWIADCESVCVSPKGPGMSPMWSQQEFPYEFIYRYREDAAEENLYFKVVCFNNADFTYAKDLHKAIPGIQMFLSVGNHDPGPTVGNMAQGDPNYPADIPHLLQRLRWLSERVCADELMRDVRVLPQMHVLTWGNERGR